MSVVAERETVATPIKKRAAPRFRAKRIATAFAALVIGLGAATKRGEQLRQAIAEPGDQQTAGHRPEPQDQMMRVRDAIVVRSVHGLGHPR